MTVESSRDRHADAADYSEKRQADRENSAPTRRASFAPELAILRGDEQRGILLHRGEWHLATSRASQCGLW